MGVPARRICSIRLLRAVTGRDQDAERALLLQHPEVVVLPGQDLAAVAQHDAETGRLRGRLDAGGHVGEERVAHVEDDQTDGAAAPRP